LAGYAFLTIKLSAMLMKDYFAEVILLWCWKNDYSNLHCYHVDIPLFKTINLDKPLSWFAELARV
jgi:hypothetical protein